ncbi:hypothetical protein DAPPUDRAFT_115089 [Daphnia pulex]|uniref:Uncharacterized protein n=1 Tax=Daphnia pulex TaxID=6669 RepID=E9HK67_DAPPU|nr:hypothetical protein DAPPUDRAFT_115089 [Daphnia pulex]|eukprot:EFX67829.1 hypothetical protein DAPPUDRAFT_115089 [Daphnia pulex]
MDYILTREKKGDYPKFLKAMSDFEDYLRHSADVSKCIAYCLSKLPIAPTLRSHGDHASVVSLEGNLPCFGNVAFYCPIGYHKESTCPIDGPLWDEIRGILIAPMESKTSLQRLMESLSWRISPLHGTLEILDSEKVVRFPLDTACYSLPVAVDEESRDVSVASTRCVPIADFDRISPCVAEVMPEDKDSSMDNTLPVPLPKSPREVVSNDDEELTQEMNDADETPEERLENMRRFREFLRNHDHAASLQRYRVKLNRQLAQRLSRLATGKDDPVSLDDDDIPCFGNVAFYCPIGYHKESTCPIDGPLWDEIHDILTDPEKKRKTSLQRLIETLSWRMDPMVGLLIILQSEEVVRSFKRSGKSPVDDVERAERDISLPAAVDVESARGVVSSTPSASTPCLAIAKTVDTDGEDAAVRCDAKEDEDLAVGGDFAHEPV